MTAVKSRQALVVTGLSAAVVAAAGAAPAAASTTHQGGRVERVSVSSTERQTAGTSSRYVKMSAHGRFVVFASGASTLVPRDTNRVRDVFVRDRARGVTVRASVSNLERQANASSNEAAISGNGRFVVFTSGASNLVRGDTNATVDVFVRDMRLGTTRRVSVGAGGAQGAGSSFLPSISADGRYVAFQSTAANLVRGDTNRAEDAFVRDLWLGRTTRVSIPRGGGQFRGASIQPVISADGRHVAFSSNPRHPDLFDVFLRDRRAGTTRRVTVGLGGRPINGNTGTIAISGNGRYVGYLSEASNIVAGDTNRTWDTFVYDACTGRTRRVSVATGGAQGNGFSDMPSLSHTGRYVAFASEASNLVRGDTNRAGDAFVRDLHTGVTRRISLAPGGAQANDTTGPNYAPEVALSADGQHAAFVSLASNLVRGDTNNAPDVFAWDAPRP